MSAAENVDESLVDPTKLIVNFLPQTVTSAALKDLFAPFGTVEDANVVSNRITKVSLGYGFVKFATEEMARRAVEMMDGKVIEGMSPDAKPLHVGISKPPKVEVNLYIGNLVNTVKAEDLLGEFSRFGTIVEYNVPIDRTTGSGRGFGFVKFDSKTSANNAMESLNGVAVDALSGARPLIVKRAEANQANTHGRNTRFGGMDHRHYRPQPRMVSYPPQPVTYDGVCVFVYNIPHQMNESGLQDLFRTYGTVLGARVMRNMNHLSKGFGFVNMSSVEEANNAIAGLNGRTLVPDKPLQVSLKRQ